MLTYSRGHYKLKAVHKMSATSLIPATRLSLCLVCVIYFTKLWHSVYRKIEFIKLYHIDNRSQ